MALVASLLTTMLGGVLAAAVARQYAERRRPHQLVWSGALLVFTVGVAGQALAEIGGWSAPLYRSWYLAGAVLAGAYLGQGTVYLLAPRRLAHGLMALLGVGTILAAAVVGAAPVDIGAVLADGAASGAGMPPAVRWLAPLFNVYGTVALLAGAALGVWRFLWHGGSGRRALGAGLIGVGALVLAAGGVLARLGLPAALYAAELIGLLVIGAGFALTARMAPPIFPGPADLASRRWRVARLGVGLATGGLLGTVALLPAVPWAMGIVGDVQHVYTEAVPAENRGAYLVTERGVVQLYSWSVEPPSFPADAPTLEAVGLRELVVVSKQFEAADRYRLYEVGGGRIDWTRASTSGTQLTLRPARALGPGAYQLVVPTDSMYGGYTWQYFRLQ